MAKEMTNFRDHQCFFLGCYLIMSSFSGGKIQKQEITEKIQEILCPNATKENEI